VHNPLDDRFFAATEVAQKQNLDGKLGHIKPWLQCGAGSL
jgi:hypothetical protein